ncbi:MAG: FixH family protein [Vicinamibacterales bacterium]
MRPSFPSRRAALSIAVAVFVTGGLASAYVYRDRLATIPGIDRLGRWQAAPSVAEAPNRSDTSMAAGGPTPAVEPARAEVTIDTRRQQLIGVRVVSVVRDSVTSAVRAPGVIRYDETRQTNVNVKIDGWIRDLDVDFTGQPVRLGQRLFTLYSPELIATQNELILALRNQEQAASSSLVDAREFSQRLVDAARQRLRLWDLSVDEIARVEASREPLQTVAIVSPASGFVTEKLAVRGMRVTAGQTLYTIADLGAVWVEADVYEQDMSLVRIGQSASVTVDAYPGRQFRGRATYIYPDVNQQTRTAKVRFQFDNAAGLLKPGMFANVELRAPERDGLMVPADAVLDAGLQQTVFVADGNGMFTPRRVTAGQRTSDSVEILEGLKEGEQVAAAATFFLDSESQLRAGLQNYQAPASSTSATTAPQNLDLAFRPLADPPRTGDNTFEVTLKDQRGQPIADAEVSVTLFMPAMPTMNMPAMRNETRLPSIGGGVYRGPGQIMSGGRWEVTVTVRRANQQVGSRQFTVLAR